MGATSSAVQSAPNAPPPTDDYRTYVCGLMGLGLPYPDTLTFSNHRPLRGLSVFNQSSCGVGFYFNRTPALGNAPDLFVPAGIAQGIPLASLQQVGVSFSLLGTSSPSGQIYVHFTTDLVVSTSSQINTLGGAMIWDQSNWDASQWNA